MTQSETAAKTSSVVLPEQLDMFQDQLDMIALKKRVEELEEEVRLLRERERFNYPTPPFAPTPYPFGPLWKFQEVGGPGMWNVTSTIDVGKKVEDS